MMTSSKTMLDINPFPSPPTINAPPPINVPPVAAPVKREPIPSPKREMTRGDPLANARISFFDPANQATADRLFFGTATGAEEDPMGNVEEMLEGIDWGARPRGTKDGGAADMIEARLLDELTALEKVCLEVAHLRSPLMTLGCLGQHPLLP